MSAPPRHAHQGAHCALLAGPLVAPSATRLVRLACSVDDYADFWPQPRGELGLLSVALCDSAALGHRRQPPIWATSASSPGGCATPPVGTSGS